MDLTKVFVLHYFLVNIYVDGSFTHELDMYVYVMKCTHLRHLFYKTLKWYYYPITMSIQGRCKQ